MYHYAGNNPIKYSDPDGNQVAVPWMLPRFVPWALPKAAPIPIPGEVCPLPIFPDSGLIRQGNQYYIERPWNGDWNHAPNGPDMNDKNSNPLGDDWEPDIKSNDKDPTGMHRWFLNKKNGERVRWDEKTETQNGHWHRLNPEKTPDRYHKYLDPDGNPVKEQNPKGHIEPNPIMDAVIMA